MDKKRGLLTFLLFVLSVAFIAFVIIMQHNFNNPELVTAQSQTDVETDTSDSKSDSDEEKDSDEKDNEEEKEDATTKKYVAVDLLNVRSEPNSDSQIVGTIQHNQEVISEIVDDSEEWVQIKTDDFSGYVKDKFLKE